MPEVLECWLHGDHVGHFEGQTSRAAWLAYDADATRVVSLSLPIGSRRHTGNITLKDWNALAVDCDLEPDHVVNIVSDVNQRLSSQPDLALEEFAVQYSNLDKAVRQMQLCTTRDI